MAVVVAKADIPARTKITQSMLEVRLVSPNAVAADAVDAPLGAGQVGHQHHRAEGALAAEDDTRPADADRATTRFRPAPRC